MTYSIRYSQWAVKELKKLEKPIAEKIIMALDRIKIRPYKYVRKILGTEYYRLKVDDYRVILDIKDDKLIILVIRAGYRKSIYKRL